MSGKVRLLLRKNRLLAGWLLGIFSSALVAGIFGSLILLGVTFDTSASSAHSKPFAWAIHVTMIHSVKRRAPEAESRDAARRVSLVSGAIEYERHCIACHGGPGVARAPWVSAMLPTPPFLIGASGRWSHAELYKLVNDGVKMTGMPAWGEVEPPQKISDVVAFVELMPRLTPDRFAHLRQRIRERPDVGGNQSLAASRPIQTPRPGDSVTRDAQRHTRR